jgi:hypothetical protein
MVLMLPLPPKGKLVRLPDFHRQSLRHCSG